MSNKKTLIRLEWRNIKIIISEPNCEIYANSPTTIHHFPLLVLVLVVASLFKEAEELHAFAFLERKQKLSFTSLYKCDFDDLSGVEGKENKICFHSALNYPSPARMKINFQNAFLSEFPWKWYFGNEELGEGGFREFREGKFRSIMRHIYPHLLSTKSLILHDVGERKEKRSKKLGRKKGDLQFNEPNFPEKANEFIFSLKVCFNSPK